MVGVNVPSNVVVDGDNTIDEVFFRRGIPSTINIGAQDDVVLSDGRAPNLGAMAVAATKAHADAELSGLEVMDRMVFIPIFERLHSTRGYSSTAIEDYVVSGTPLVLPGGPGATFFQPGGACAECHGGPMMNTTVDGHRLANNMVSSRNALGNGENAYSFDGASALNSPDPGHALTTGDAADFEHFKIPSLFNAGNTAPYFHDSSAKTLEDAVRHYDAVGLVSLSEADVADIVAFLELLTD
jgi:cytochrome c peroxidase